MISFRSVTPEQSLNLLSAAVVSMVIIISALVPRAVSQYSVAISMTEDLMVTILRG